MILDLASKIKLAVTGCSVLLVAFLLISYQKSQINTQKKLIAGFEKEINVYESHISALIDEQKKINVVFKQFDNKRKRSNRHFDKIEKKLNYEYNRHTWDQEKVPNSILCIIKCMQYSETTGECDCS